MLFDNYTLRTVALGTAALGAVSGALGTFAVLRRQSLLGDAVSHAALPGVALAFALTHSKAPLVLAAGAAVAGWLGTLAVLTIVRRSRVSYDSALGIVLSVFFGFGVVLLTWLQKRPDASQAGLERYLFGQAATLLESDVRALAGLGAVAVAVLLALWKEFKLLAFDPDYAATLGLPVRPLDYLLTGLLVLAVVLGLQCVGVVLMSALVVAPAAAARQWSDRLGVVVLLAAAFGGLSGLGGTLAGDALSAPGKPVPTGPAIVLVATGIVLVSLVKKALAARRGPVSPVSP
jgi:manganese/zinc/iron transport system permease protein